jgi:hypothetical protein
MEFIYECEGLFSSTFCDHVIKKFEESDYKVSGITMSNLADNSQKKSLDLPTYKNPQWTQETQYFLHILKIGIKKYVRFIQDMQVDDQIKEEISGCLNKSFIHPPQIQKTVAGGYFHWHHDECGLVNPRMITYIIYLNDVDEDSGGSTEFACGKVIQPKAGKIVFFPSTWTYYHRGKTLENGVKYIATASLDRVPPHISASLN